MAEKVEEDVDYCSRLEWLGEEEGDSTERMLEVEVEGVKLERD